MVPLNRLTKYITRLLVYLLMLGMFPLASFQLNASDNSTTTQDKKKKKKKKKKGKSQKKSKKEKASQASKYAKRGSSKSKKKDYKGALSDYKKAYQLNPTSNYKKRVQQLTSLAKKKTSRKKSAKKSKKKSVEKKTAPAKTRSVYQVSDDIFQLTHDLDVSMRRMEKALHSLKPSLPEKTKLPMGERLQRVEKRAAEQPESILAQRELALEYERKGLYSKSKDIYLRLIGSNPSVADYHYFLGSLYSKIGQHHKARFAYEEALEIEPNHIGTINALSLYSGEPQGDKMAKDLFSKAAAREPDGPASLLNLVRESLGRSSYDEALSLASNGVSRYPDNHIFPYLEGQAYENLGELEQAKKSYKTSLSMDRNDPTAAVALGNLYYNQGNFLYAAVTYDNVLPVVPQDTKLRFKQGLSYFKAFEWSKTAAAWEDLLIYSPNHPEVRVLLPQVYYIMSNEYNRSGYTDLGRQAFANALSVNPNTHDWFSKALRTSGEYYREHGLYREALRAYQDAIDIDPGDPEHYNGLGITYWHMGEREMAAAAWQKSLLIQPDENSAQGWLIIANRGNS